MSEPNKFVIHVALVGTTGIGKSTLVNVLKGKKEADVNNDATPCTSKPTKYEVVEEGTTYCIWDTRGLNEPSKQIPISTRVLRFAGIKPGADRQLRKLLHRRVPSIDLVLLCIDARKIGIVEYWKLYKNAYSDCCARGLKVAVVVTRMEASHFSSEWKRTCQATARLGLKEFPDAGMMMEAVPMFRNLKKLDDMEVKKCRRSILTFVSNVCPRQSMESSVEHR